MFEMLCGADGVHFNTTKMDNSQSEIKKGRKNVGRKTSSIKIFSFKHWSVIMKNL